MTALEQLMNVGQGKLHFESIRAAESDFDVLLQKCRDYALKRRLESNHKRGKDDMDVDHVEDVESNMNMGGRYWDPYEWETTGDPLHAVYQGKGKGK